MTKYLNGNPFNFSNKHFKFSTFLLGHCDVLMRALCTNNKEIHDKLKFLQLGKDVVRQRILSVVIELSRIFCIFLYILVNLSILLCSSSTFVNFCVFLYTSCSILSVRLCILAVGVVPSPFDCYLANRGLRTLHVRMRAHAENALAVAKYTWRDHH